MREASVAVLLAASIYLIMLGLVALLSPAVASRFLRQFAQTARANAIEACCRLTAGLAFIYLSSELPLPALFTGLGAVLAISALWMLAFPGAHKEFANRVLPTVGQLMPLIGVTSLVGGICLAIALPPFQNGLHSLY